MTKVDKGSLWTPNNIKYPEEHEPQVGSLGQASKIVFCEGNIFITNNKYVACLRQLHVIIN